jgi:hypothetical protein
VGPLSPLQENKWGEPLPYHEEKEEEEEEKKMALTIGEKEVGEVEYQLFMAPRRPTWREECLALLHRSWISYYRTPFLIMSKCLQICKLMFFFVFVIN